MDPESDAFGQALREYHDGGEAYEIVERDDGYVDANPVEMYFRPYGEWNAGERKAIERAEGRVLDVGCGAGRHALYLQERGYDVVGLDLSPGALNVAEERGLEETARMAVTDLADYDGEPFDTVLMFGNNFGLVGTRERAPEVLSALSAATTDGAVIFAESMDPYATDDPGHLEYHERNEERGRMAGAIRMRVRYKHAATDWYDYLLVSREEMESVVEGTGWRVREFVEGDAGPGYVGVLEKA